ncbi:LacI family DNA-binding transcriptional regulator [Corynebacterium deserti]|uniref:LacI family DNA-binding transcriptional regulator n=1 Tax=Corynebacterium deserti TaxID=1408191 RepID=UPI0038B36DE7
MPAYGLYSGLITTPGGTPEYSVDRIASNATINDVAKVAGVSPSTVSRAFSQPGRVSFATACHGGENSGASPCRWLWARGHQRHPHWINDPAKSKASRVPWSAETTRCFWFVSWERFT